MKFLKYIFILSITINCASIYSQIDSSNLLPKDTLLPEYIPIILNDYSFLIEDDVYYNFFINNLIPLKDGYFLECYTYIDTLRVWAHIVTSKKSITKNGQKIKPYEYINLSLKRYYKKPSIAGIEAYPIYDDMFGNSTLSIVSGCFYYLFTSLNLDGLHYNDSIDVIKKEMIYENEKNEIISVIDSFIMDVSFRKNQANSYDYMNKKLVRKSIKKFSQDILYRSRNYFDVPRNLHPEYKVKKLNWQKEHKINPNNFSELFPFMLKEYYKLPTILKYDSTSNIPYKKEVDFLFLEKDVFTIRVTWFLFYKKKEYVAILNMKKINGKYQIIGFNKPFEKKH